MLILAGSEFFLATKAYGSIYHLILLNCHKKLLLFLYLTNLFLLILEKKSQALLRKAVLATYLFLFDIFCFFSALLLSYKLLPRLSHHLFRTNALGSSLDISSIDEAHFRITFFS